MSAGRDALDGVTLHWLLEVPKRCSCARRLGLRLLRSTRRSVRLRPQTAPTVSALATTRHCAASACRRSLVASSVPGVSICHGVKDTYPSAKPEGRS
jgi:hypothetical protein